MEDCEIFDKLINIGKTLFKDKLNVDFDNLKLSTDLIKDLSFDSINLVIFSLAIEREFDIDISELSNINVFTISNVIKYIKNRAK